MNPPTIQFDRRTLERLKKARDQAVRDGYESFVFDGHELLVAYAKHLIAYLEENLG